MTHGHTMAMLELIKRPRLVYTADGLPKSVGDAGGISERTAATCLARMQNWWTLAQSVLKTEFPDADITTCFSAFDLHSVAGGPPAHVRPVPRDELLCVAEFLALDGEGLIREFRELRAVAEGILQKSHCSNISAWAAAVADTGGIRLRAQYPLDNLLPALRRYVIYSGSSAGVEQCFSRAKALLREHRNFKPNGKQRVLVLATSTPEDRRDTQLCHEARLVWARNFGVPRNKRRPALPARLCVLERQQKRKAENHRGLASGQQHRRLALESLPDSPGAPALATRAKKKARRLLSR